MWGRNDTPKKSWIRENWVIVYLLFTALVSALFLAEHMMELLGWNKSQFYVRGKLTSSYSFAGFLAWMALLIPSFNIYTLFFDSESDVIQKRSKKDVEKYMSDAQQNFDRRLAELKAESRIMVFRPLDLKP